MIYYNLNKKTYLSILICTIYAISDEIHQIFVPERNCHIIDILIDSIGSMTGIYIMYLIFKVISNKK